MYNKLSEASYISERMLTIRGVPLVGNILFDLPNTRVDH